MRSIGNLKITGEDLKGLKRVAQVLNEYKQHRVKVGFLGGSYPNGESYASVAYLHEFGSETPRTFVYKGKNITIKGVPTRSILRVPIKSHPKKLRGKDDIVRAALLLDLKHGYTGVALKMLGANAEKIVQEAFDTQGYGKWEHNISKKYKILKGSDIPLIDTGKLRGAVASQVYKEGV